MSIDFYNQNADDFFENTVNVDMSSLYGAFTQHLPQGAKILDAGCGSGRDSKAFAEMGYDVTAFDASAEMVERATAHAGIPVHQLHFDEIPWVDRFDGIWSCASLLHVPRAELPKTLQTIANALKANGTWYASFKYGNSEREKEGRHFTDLDEAQLAELIQPLLTMEITKVWITEDKRPDRNEQWLNVVLRKAAK
ncbi:class I SAM-dependent methyltransferase [Ferrimonas balearica]|uniref:class I SAM-dependent methyltransferase n=1 Tax=Ferrimonas balearica TaxID=44012 RepID=UPI001C977B91|nr:class I SAM-dependent methyltransferase [Ferrimonas balearica]MBY6107314.1 class I SAM-dependent methyltransferase [Ferrimonas balearica]